MIALFVLQFLMTSTVVTNLEAKEKHGVHTEWTTWYDMSVPSLDGEYEKRSDIPSAEKPCLSGSPYHVECSTAEKGQCSSDKCQRYQQISCTSKEGFICKTSASAVAHNGCQCCNYRVRYLCKAGEEFYNGKRGKHEVLQAFNNHKKEKRKKEHTNDLSKKRDSHQSYKVSPKTRLSNTEIRHANSSLRQIYQVGNDLDIKAERAKIKKKKKQEKQIARKQHQKHHKERDVSSSSSSESEEYEENRKSKGTNTRHGHANSKSISKHKNHKHNVCGNSAGKCNQQKQTQSEKEMSSRRPNKENTFVDTKKVPGSKRQQDVQRDTRKDEPHKKLSDDNDKKKDEQHTQRKDTLNNKAKLEHHHDSTRKKADDNKQTHIKHIQITTVSPTTSTMDRSTAITTTAASEAMTTGDEAVTTADTVTTASTAEDATSADTASILKSSNNTTRVHAPTYVMTTSSRSDTTRNTTSLIDRGNTTVSATVSSATTERSRNNSEGQPNSQVISSSNTTSTTDSSNSAGLWTSWYNDHSPDLLGERELLVDLSDHRKPCGSAQPVSVQCSAAPTSLCPALPCNLTYSCTPTAGLLCDNAGQLTTAGGCVCCDMVVRYLCPVGIQSYNESASSNIEFVGVDSFRDSATLHKASEQSFWRMYMTYLDELAVSSGARGCLHVKLSTLMYCVCLVLILSNVLPFYMYLY